MAQSLDLESQSLRHRARDHREAAARRPLRFSSCRSASSRAAARRARRSAGATACGRSRSSSNTASQNESQLAPRLRRARRLDRRGLGRWRGIGIGGVRRRARHVGRRRIGLVLLCADGEGVRERQCAAARARWPSTRRGPTRRDARARRLHRLAASTPDAAAPICAPGMSVLMAPLAAIVGQRRDLLADADRGVRPGPGAHSCWPGTWPAAMAGATAAMLTATSPIVLFQAVQPMNDIADGRAVAGGARALAAAQLSSRACSSASRSSSVRILRRWPSSLAAIPFIQHGHARADSCAACWR